MRIIFTFLFLISQIVYAHALIINEIMSNPIGDDGGREWIELYNDTNTDITLTGLTVSIKGGSFITVTPVSGGASIGSHGYAIIGSTASGVTKFALDYPAYTGPLFKSSISLVNTGVTSVEIKLDGVNLDSIPSYTAAKEGNTYSRIGGGFVIALPTPGEENGTGSTGGGGEDATTTPPTGTQATLPQMSPPSSDIVIYLPSEKTVVAGAPSLFSVYGLTHDGRTIEKLSYKWSFGEGGESTGSTTLYRYLYPGRYVAQVEATNGLVAGTGRMLIKVVAPDIEVSSVAIGKYGKYIDIKNPNKYDLDISDWKLLINEIPFSFPKNTIVLQGSTRFPLTTMGFASTTISSSTLIKILFPTNEEVVRVYQKENFPLAIVATTHEGLGIAGIKKAYMPKLEHVQKSLSGTSSKATSSTTFEQTTKKDTRIASFMRSIFGK